MPTQAVPNAPLLFSLLSSRPAREIIENKQGEEIVIQDLGPRISSVFVSHCKGCTIVVRGNCTNVTIERSDDTTFEFGCIKAAIEVVKCSGLIISTLRCRTITIDMSTQINVTSRCQPQAPDGRETSGQESTPAGFEEEMKKLRFFTSSSEGVRLTIEGGGSHPLVPDTKYEKGDSPRSVTTVEGPLSAPMFVTTKCNQFGDIISD
ncbi:unnamed protein product [Discosporangium mesarthrocarpum]